MAYLLVKYLHRKYKERQASKTQTEATEHVGPTLSAVESGDQVQLQALPREAAVSVKDSHPSIKHIESKNNISTSDTKGAWLWRLTLMAALFFPILLETLDYTIVATAQPQIASYFHRLDLQSYVGTSYLLSSTVFLPVFSSLADIYGRHDALQLALVFFIIGCALSTGAVSMTMVLLGRGIAGIGAAGMLTIVRIILADSSSLDDNNWQQTLMFILFATGYSIGPVIGGYLVAVSFRWIFAINLPCAAIAMVLAFVLLRNKVKAGRPSHRLPTSSLEQHTETPIQKLLRMDWIGAFIFIASGILILLALNWGSNDGWNVARVIVSFVIGGLLMVTFVFWQCLLERKLSSPISSTSSSNFSTPEPMIPLDVFRSYDVCVVQYASFVSGMVMLVMFYFVAIFMTIVYGLSASQAGVQLVYFAPGMGGGSIIAINVIRIFRQPRYPIVLGSIVITVAIGLVQMAMNSGSKSEVNGFMAMAGVGVGMTFGPLAIQARFSQSASRVAAVTGLTLFFRSLGGTVGLAQCAAVLSARVSRSLSHAAKSGALSASAAAALSNAGADSTSSISSIDSLSPELQAIVRDAFRDGTRWAFISLIPWCAISVFMTVFLSKISDSDAERRELEAKKNAGDGDLREKDGAGPTFAARDSSS